MKIQIKIVLLYLNIIPVSLCNAQEDISAKITESAINARIEKIRMGDLIVKAEPGVLVKIEQIRHEFLFGTAIPNHLAEQAEDAMSPEDREKYLSILEQNFNYADHENAVCRTSTC